MAPLRFAIVSFAHIHAWSYARVLKELEAEGEARLVAIYDDDPDRLREAAQRYHVQDTYTDLDKLLARDDVDAVIVTSENAKHVVHAVPAAEAGKHLIVEKPIATTLGDADRIVRAAEKAGVKLQTAFVMRYHDATATVKDILARGDIGDILVITTTNHGTYPDLWFGDKELAGGGSMMDHTVHTADLMRWYTGSEAEEVYAVSGANIRDYLEVEDTGLVSLRFKNGVIGSIDCSWSRPSTWPTWGDVWLGILGTEGYIVVDAFRPALDVVREGERLRWEYFGSDADYNMVADFVRVVREDGEPRASGWDGRQALEITLAAYKAVETGRPVKLPLE